MSAKKVLIITYYWPPSGGVGVQRWLHFAINLNKLGFEPVIYTPEKPQFEILDESIVDLVADIEVLKKPIWEPFAFFHKLTKNKNKVTQGTVLEKPKQTLKDKLFIWIRGNFFIPDPRVFWVKPSVKFLGKYLLENKINTIITTGPPHSMHLIGLGLKKSINHLKWLADFRDPWSDWDILQKLNTSALAMSRHRFLEKRVLENANVVLTVSKRLGKSLQEKMNDKVNVQVIMNGIASSHSEKPVYTSYEKFVIGYFGMLNELRDPETLWLALEQLCAEKPEIHDRLEIR
ncbi:MAG: glycosyltransferase involved in cell wall biosynthesis, partial [Cyclobacteriaceae bacterium]